jgi:thiol-disulfide isomerase/thioredoxin
MLPEPLFRVLLSVGLLLVGVGIYHGINMLLLYKNRHHSSHLDHFQKGKPAILYFTTPDCAPCKTVQRPALNKLQGKLGDRLQIIEVDAYDQPDLAKTWGVMSVPTTFILDSQGTPRHVNHGATSASKLLEQLSLVK